MKNAQTTKRKDLIAKALLALAAIGLVGCAEQASLLMTNGNSIVAGNRSAGSVVNPVINTLPLIGVVYTDASQQAAFQMTVAGLVSTDMPEGNLGSVSARFADGTGVAFAGKVTFTNGAVLSQYGGWSTLTVASNSVLRVDVQHSLQNQIGKPSLPFSQATGYIQGSKVYLRFMDKLGYVQMNGQIINQRFQGAFEFDNYLKYDGSRPGAAGTLGNFDVAACDFFKCY